MDIRVFGAGPAGSSAAYELAKQGHEVTLYEEHHTIGTPIQCTGILTNAIDDCLDVPKKVIDYKIKNVRVHAPNKKHLQVAFHKPNLVVCRTKFDQWLAKRAEKAGATIETGVKLIEAGKKLKVQTATGTEHWKHTTTIGADGPQSRVSKFLNPKRKRTYFGGMQVTIKKDNDGAIEFHPHIADIAWATPENATHMRVGVMSRGNTRAQFEKISKLYPGKVVAKQAGAIPVYDPHLKRCGKGFFTIGDAAAMVKATTGGGIVQSIKAAPLLAHCITHNRGWSNSWRMQQGFDLWLHLKLRNKLDTFSDNAWNKLIDRCQDERVQHILNTIPRDNPSQMLPRLALTKPSLVLSALGL